MKYILKESELCSILNKIIMEEISTLDESILKRVGGTLGNVAKMGALAILAPGIAANKLAGGVNDVFSGKQSVGSQVKSFFGGENEKGKNATKKKTRAEKQRERLLSGRNLNYEYGKPETVPGWGRRTRLAKKSEIVAPQTNNGITWGPFGNHYHDEGDRAWGRKVLDIENALVRNANGDSRRTAKLQKRYERILRDWLKDRDKEYEIYIKGVNQNR